MHLWLALVAACSMAHMASSSSSSGSQSSRQSSQGGEDQIPLFGPSTSSTSITLNPNEWSPDSPSTPLDPTKWSPDENESASGSTSVDEDPESGPANGSSELLKGNSVSSANTATKTSLRGSSSTSDTSGSASASECAGSSVWISVETMLGVFCLPKGAAVCSGNTAYGKCPEAQTGLPYGSYCAEIHPHVFGCRPWAKPVSSPNGLSPSTSSSTSA